jgi:hypothetical protein
MQDILSDYKRWSRAERIIAVVFAALLAILAPTLFVLGGMPTLGSL